MLAAILHSLYDIFLLSISLHRSGLVPLLTHSEYISKMHLNSLLNTTANRTAIGTIEADRLPTTETMMPLLPLHHHPLPPRRHHLLLPLLHHHPRRHRRILPLLRLHHLPLHHLLQHLDELQEP